MNHRQLFWRVTLRQELFTHLVAVPLLCYMALVASGIYRDSAKVEVAILAALLNAGYLLVGIFIWRWFYLRRLLSRLNLAFKTGDQESLVKIRTALLRYPILEMWIIAGRFFIGISTFIITMYLIFGWMENLNYMYPFALLIDIPISMVVYLFLTQSAVRDIVKQLKVHEIGFPRQELNKISYFWRALLGFASVAIMPFAFFVYLFIALERGYVTGSSIVMHVIVISFLVSISVALISIIATRSIKRVVEQSGQSMKLLGEGRFDIESEPYTADEFGLLAYDISRVAGQLKIMYNDLRDLNLNLEKKVDNRTRELESSLNSLRELKEKQDGDYFLTSLLQNPLNGVHGTSPNVEAEILVRQLTRLSFRGRPVEIGGDLCSVHQIELRGRKYTAFVNADAMGKSIQGAGGAIVLGSAFQSIVARSVSSTIKDQFPEKWLHNCYLDLQAIFVTFDGSMLISAVLGLIDDQNGLCYFINAEHPAMVLLHKGQAQFLEATNKLLKIGVDVAENNPQIMVHPLELDDILVLGSDGRDDIITSVHQNGTRVINENENLFLAHVQNNAANLQAIQTDIDKTGKAMDDLSLMRLAYRADQSGLQNARDLELQRLLEEGREARRSGNTEQALEILSSVLQSDPTQIKAHYQLALLYLRQRNYSAALPHCLQVMEEYPEDDDFLHYTAYALKKQNRLTEAYSAAERLNLRNHTHSENLLNLTDIALRLGRSQIARRIFARLDTSSIDPKRIQRLADRIQNSQ